MKKEFILVLIVSLVIIISGCSSYVQEKKRSINDQVSGEKQNPNVQDKPLEQDKNYFVDTEPCVSSTETCDGKDNDCDGKVDEGIGLCTFRSICSNGRCVYCPLGKSFAEVCDGKDNDCDGQIDEEVRDKCGNCISSNNLYPINRELCDGKDNDCDGQIDEEEGNVCNNYVCRTTSGGDTCDKDANYRCINKECRSTKVCQDQENCYWDWVGEEGKVGTEGMRDVKLWAGKPFEGTIKYYCGKFDTKTQTVYSSCEGSGCTTQLCRGGSDCPLSCYITVDGSLLHLKKCIQYPSINKLCR